MTETDALEDDPTHPIPSFGGIDILAKRRDGGVTLVVVVSGPLDGGDRSRRRLWHKLERYFGFIASTRFRDEFGEPSAEKVEVTVQLDAKSDPAIRDMLREWEPWAKEQKLATLVVEAR